MSNALRLWVGARSEKMLVLVPGETGMPEPVDLDAPILRVRYLSPNELEQQLERGHDLLDRGGSLLVRTSDSEAPPSVTTLLFAPEGNEQEVAISLGGHPKRIWARLYLAATASGATSAWHSDLSQGKLGYFVTGMLNQHTIWGIRRVETDFANRLSFTIQPLTLPNGLPAIEVGAVKNAMIRQEVEQHWREFTEVFLRGLPYRTVNAAKDLCDSLLLDVLVGAGYVEIGNRDFKKLLDVLRGVIDRERQSETKSVPFRDLHYHLMSKLRILHGHTHVGRVAVSGKIHPELALSVVQDVVEVLRAAGVVARPQ